MEKINGIKIDNIEKLNEKVEDKVELVKKNRNDLYERLEYELNVGCHGEYVKVQPSAYIELLQVIELAIESIQTYEAY